VKSQIPIEELLRWRLSQAEAEAPPAPRAARLLEMARPWWEVLPRQFEELIQRLSAIQVAYGHAMAEPCQSHSGHRVAVLILRGAGELETSARLLYFAVRDGQLRLRFNLEKPPSDMRPAVEVTFISEHPPSALFSASATVSIDDEYRLEAELPAELAHGWQQLKVTDRMPFRFILRADRN